MSNPGNNILRHLSKTSCSLASIYMYVQTMSSPRSSIPLPASVLRLPLLCLRFSYDNLTSIRKCSMVKGKRRIVIFIVELRAYVFTFVHCMCMPDSNVFLFGDVNVWVMIICCLSGRFPFETSIGFLLHMNHYCVSSMWFYKTPRRLEWLYLLLLFFCLRLESLRMSIHSYEIYVKITSMT